MIGRLIGAFNRLLNAEYSLTELVQKFKNIFKSVFEATETSDTAVLFDMAKGMLGQLLTFLPMVLLALCAIEVFFGKKLLGVQKFFVCFLGGLVFGAYFLDGVVSSFVALPDYVVGAVVGMIFAILYKLLYYIGYIGTFGYVTYLVCFSGAYLEMVTAYTKGNLVFSAAAAGIVALVALILHKPIEMLGTSALGAYGIVSIVDKNFFDFGTVGFASETLIKLAVIAVITIVGFIVQFKTRKRY